MATVVCRRLIEMYIQRASNKAIVAYFLAIVLDTKVNNEET